MEFNFGNSRPRSTQQVLQFTRTAPGDDEPAIQLSQTIDETRLITTFMVSNFSDAPASVFLSASQGMTAPIEIVPGATPVFTAWQEGRQLYELQILIQMIASQTAMDLIQIPVIVWDLREWWLRSATPTPIDVTITAFPLPYL